MLGVLVLAAAAAALPPAQGTVVEGHSLPGVALGASRAQVQTAWGAPASCYSPSLCAWQRPDGAAELSFQRRRGGPATGKPRDVVVAGDFAGIPGWVTTAGVSTASALSDPESVPLAYPLGHAYRFPNGHLRLLIDPAQGLEITWTPEGSSYLVTIAICANVC
jgi:hypothetical protein